MVDGVEMLDTQEILSQGMDEPVLQEPRVIYGYALDAIHPHTTSSLNNQAILYYNQGKYEKARELFQRTLTLCEQLLGFSHADTATCLNNLAGVYYVQGKYELAELLLHQALDICEQVLSPDDPDMINSLNNLGLLYEAQGKY